MGLADGEVMHVFATFSNWRTTLMGVAAIMAALGDIFNQIATKDWDGTRFGADITGLFTGMGLLFSRDAVASEKDHLKDRVAIAENSMDIAGVQQDAVVAKEVAVVAKQEVANLAAAVETVVKQ